MGRRKIEIAPITHERNRSVTFLKRKNGLFKKAFELGVLCSVDVAVIIFEERPGHDPKLHQYCSGDIHSIVQRQLQFRGDKDHKGPGDFSGQAPQFINGAEDDVGDDDEDESLTHPLNRSSKRKAGKMSTTPERASNDDEYVPPGSHRGRGAPRMSAPSLHNPHSRGGGARFDDGPSGSLLPVSNDRVSSLRDSGQSISYGGHPRSQGHGGTHKRPRGPLDSMDPGRRSRSPQDTLISTRGGSGSDLYLPDPPGGQARFGAATSNARGAYGGPAGGPGAGSYGAPHYQPMFPVPGHAQSPPTPSFIPVQGGGGLPFASSNERDGYDDGVGRGRGGFGDAPYDYPTMMGRGGAYGQQQQHQQHQPPRGDMFATFLEADQRIRQQGAREPGRPGNGLEWPTHDGPPVDRERGIMEGAPPINLQQGPPTQDTWFDIFSNSNSATAPGAGPASGGASALSSMPPPTRVPSRPGSGSATQQSQSWERASVPSSTAGASSMEDLATIFGAENVPTAGRPQEGGRGAPGEADAPPSAPGPNQHAVVDIPAAQQPAASGHGAKATAPANGDVIMHPVSEGATAAAGPLPLASATASASADADAEMLDADRDGDGDADADADADADGEVNAEVDMDKERDAEGEQQGK